jgi:hypothetical protein
MKKSLTHIVFSVFAALLMLFAALPREWYHDCDHDKAVAETGFSESAYDCPVCDYVFSFTVSPENELEGIPTLAISSNISSNYSSTFCGEMILSGALRGPPCA